MKENPVDLYILFIQRSEAYDEQYAPEALLAWDEYSVDENPEGFQEAVQAAVKTQGSGISAHKVVRVSVNQAEIRRILIGVPKIEGKIEE